MSSTQLPAAVKAAPVPVVQTQARRFVGPDGSLIEPIEQPLYSSFALDNAALPQEANFFGYGVGDLVPGAGNAANQIATLFHTNLDRGGQLSRPKLFTATGVRFHLLPLAFTTAANTPELSDPSFAAAAADSDLFEDLLATFWSGFLRFTVGEKEYVNEPLWLCPANIGFDGLAAVSAGANAGAVMSDVTLPNSIGVARSFDPYPILISSMQSFSMRIRWPWATNPSLNDDRLAVIILDGKLSREVQ